MAYTNVPEYLVAKLRVLLTAEFGAGVPVFYGSQGHERAAEWFELRLLTSELVELAAFAETRRYHFEVAYLRREDAETTQEQRFERLEMAERMRRELIDQTHVASYWFDGEVGLIDYDYRPERGDQKLLGVRMEYHMTYCEAIS